MYVTDLMGVLIHQNLGMKESILQTPLKLPLSTAANHTGERAPT